MKRNIEIDRLAVTGLQTRVAVDDAAMADYAEAMRGGASFPPVTVYEDADGTLYLADGYHRVGAAKIAGKSSICADVRAGTFADALKYALGANANHGLRRTNADKQRCLQLAWENRRALFGDNDPTADWLAETCGVSRVLAQQFYGTICKTFTDLTPVRQNADGRKYTVPTRPTAARTVPTRPVPTRAPEAAADTPTVKPGYHIAEDGKVHADGVILDRFYEEIPDALQAAFKSSELEEIISDVLRIKTRILKSIKDNNIAFAAVSQRAVIELDNAYHEVKAAKPWCVCRICQGNGCRACGGTGFQTEEQYNRIPPEMRDERERLITR